jgi:hypothetical protein|tara:strand:+ start:2073 stop:2240 length:168 start_codon:yes stop_codon:yes gene_type:complete
MIHERTDIVEYTIDDMEAYAKEQVIKELEAAYNSSDEACNYVPNYIEDRIKELKQ